MITKIFGYDKALPMNTGVEGGETAVKLWFINSANLNNLLKAADGAMTSKKSPKTRRK